MAIDPQTGITYTERFREPQTSPKETWAHGAENRRTRIVDIPWVKRSTWCIQHVGTSYAVVLGTARVIQRVLPADYPEGPLGQKCVRCDVEGIGVDQVNGTANDSGTMPRYAKARVTMHYEQLPYKCIPDSSMPSLVTGAVAPDESSLLRFISRTYHPAGEFLTIPYGLMKWVVSPVVGITQPMPRIVPFVEVGYTWHLVPSIPLANIETAAGTVNNAAFDTNNPILAGGYDAQTLLFVACDIEPIFNINGYTFQATPNGANDESFSTNLLYNIHYRFKYLPNKDLASATKRGHNWFLGKPGGAALNYFQVSEDGTAGAKGPYPTSDFTKLFTL